MPTSARQRWSNPIGSGRFVNRPYNNETAFHTGKAVTLFLVPNHEKVSIDGRNGGAVVSPADHIVDGGLTHTADITQPIN